MDCGCYAIHSMRHILGEEPVECTSSEVTPSYRTCGVKNDEEKKQIDGTTIAEYSFPSGAVGKIECSLNGSLFKDSWLPYMEVQGTKGSLHWTNLVLPTAYHSITVKTDKGTRTEKNYGDGGATYLYQLRAFADAVFEHKPLLTPGEDGVKNMRVVDMTYRKAGLLPRGEIN